MATTEAPALAKLMAMPRPNPRLAPVTNAVLPASSCVDMTRSPADLLAAGRHYGPTPGEKASSRTADRFGTTMQTLASSEIHRSVTEKSGDRADRNLLAVARV